MASQPNGDRPSHPEADLAQAFKDIASGERAAASLEQTLDKLEERIEELLQRAQENQRVIDAEKNGSSQSTAVNGASTNGEKTSAP